MCVKFQEADCGFSEELCEWAYLLGLLVFADMVLIGKSTCSLLFPSCRARHGLVCVFPSQT